MLARFNFKKIAAVYVFLVILGVLIIWQMNPAGILKEARDEQRLAELSSIDKAVDFAISQNPSLFQGELTVVYLSLPDLDGDGKCLEYVKLPSLASGWRYSCVREADLSRVDGKGWIPVDFTSVPIPSLDFLPVDPLNDAALGFYYAYAPDWEINAQLESVRYNSPESEEGASSDGGNTRLLYEVGNDISLMPAVISDRTGEAEVVLKMDESCGEGLATANPFFTKWTVLGSGTVTITKLWYFQPDASLASDETLSLAIYNSGIPNYTQVSEIVKIYGTGQPGWLSGVLEKPVVITLGQGYFFGARFEGGESNTLVDKIPFCERVSSQGGSYVFSQTRELGREVILESQSADRYGFFGVSYLP